MNRAYKSLKGFLEIGLSLLFLISSVQGGDRLENMDLTALSGEAAQVQKRLAKNPSDYEALQSMGIITHYMAIKDSKTYAKKAVQFLEQSLKSKPDNYTVLCCLGSAYTLLAKDAGNPMDKSRFSNKGFEYMDVAVRKDPDNIMVRMIRANNSKGLPKFLNRRATAYEDFEYLVGLFDKGLKVPSQLKASVYRSLAAMNQEDGHAALAKKYQTLVETLEKEK